MTPTDSAMSSTALPAEPMPGVRHNDRQSLGDLGGHSGATYASSKAALPTREVSICMFPLQDNAFLEECIRRQYVFGEQERSVSQREPALEPYW